MEQVRVRFAPSPTGYLHIGGARTALYNWFFARQHNGKLVLRIEDTDSDRLKEDSISQILSSLTWLGIDWDEGPEKGGEFGPYFQSQRQDYYTAAAETLIRNGKAYYCFCTAEELETERNKQRKNTSNIGYGGKCRDLTTEEIQQKLEQGLKPVIRIKLPKTGKLVVKDIIRGTVGFGYDQFDDFIIMKSNGLPAYNFACAVDDHAMKISHVIRAEEHLSNTPKQQFIYMALDYPIPKFAHLSMILAPDRSKLSKRHGATSVSEFQEMGCLPDALVNYLTLLGWSPAEGENEITTPEQTIRSFALEKVSKTAAVYDTQKLIWLNGQYIKDYDPEKLAAFATPFFIAEGLLTESEAEENKDRIIATTQAVRERTKTLKEMAEACSYFFKDITDYEEKGIEKYFSQENVELLLAKCLDRLSELEKFDLENTEKVYKDIAEEMAVRNVLLIHPTRLALTGRTTSPGLFDVMVLLGKERCLERLGRAIDFIRSYKKEQAHSDNM